MTSKHTPGPWQAALERGCHGVIASTLPEGGANFVAIVGNDGDTPEREPERFANCHLIAAAPELLEACENWLELIERTASENKLFMQLYANSQMDFMQGLNETRAAIAKAKGEA